MDSADPVRHRGCRCALVPVPAPRPVESGAGAGQKYSPRHTPAARHGCRCPRQSSYRGLSRSGKRRVPVPGRRLVPGCRRRRPRSPRPRPPRRRGNRAVPPPATADQCRRARCRAQRHTPGYAPLQAARHRGGDSPPPLPAPTAVAIPESPAHLDSSCHQYAACAPPLQQAPYNSP